MTDIKKAIEDKIGPTNHHKTRVWQKMQQKPKRKWAPYFIGIVFTCIMLLFIASLFPSLEEEQATIHEDEEKSKLVPIFSTHVLDMRPMSYTEDYVIKLIENEETYAQIADLYGYSIGNVDFSRGSVVYAQFVSDGCGLVVNDLRLLGDQLQVSIDLPEHLRNETEVFCTLVGKKNSVLLVIPKIQATTAVITRASHVFETSFEVPKVKEPNLLLEKISIKKMIFTQVDINRSFEITNAAFITNIAKILSYAEKNPGIANIASPTWRATIYGQDGELKKFFLHFSEDYSNAWLVDAAETHTLYTLDKTLAPQLFNMMHGE